MPGTATHHRLTGGCGVEVSGVLLADGPPPAHLREALLTYGVLVFRDQHSLTPATHVAFARHFGQVTPLPAGLPEQPEVTRIQHDQAMPPKENIWHTDQSFLAEPPKGAILAARTLPPTGGDTLFADMRAAWRRLPAELRSVLRTLRAEHNITKHVPRARHHLFEQMTPTVHPVMRIHPETGEETLFVNPAYTTRVLDVADHESAAILDHLFRQAWIPELQCRIRWEAGTVVMWDNHSTQHYAVADYFPDVRIMDRVVLT
jgi:taurine dioxygenase